MGKGWHAKRKKKGAHKDGEDADEEGPKRSRKDEPARNDIWREAGNFDLENEAYEAYYKRQAVCPEEDWPKLVQAFRTGLPLAIRVNRTRIGALSLCERLEEMRKECSEDPDREQYVPQHLTWYPHSSAWMWSGLERRTVKKDKRNAQLKAFLLQRERSGLLSRQEAVSMIPPLFLCIEQHHLVLDLCAAPGSKTSQMIEMLHWPDKARGSCLPQGMVLANELQWKRANMLAHQVQRMGSPCSAVVNMDAQFFPEHWEKNEAGGYQLFKYDRVLCDVPCSGDGTMRKTPYIWRSWTAKDGFSLHFRQLAILYRGLEHLKVGGRLVYSTCSLNPLEDEAVVCAALQRHGDAIVLASPPDLPGLKAVNGVERWLVQDPEGGGAYYETYEDVPQDRKESKCKVLPSMFPPPKGEAGAAISASIRQNCRRLLPHLMDTGGFFVAAFEKRAELKPSAKARREGKREQILAKRAEQQQEQHQQQRDGEEDEEGRQQQQQQPQEKQGTDTSGLASLPADASAATAGEGADAQLGAEVQQPAATDAVEATAEATPGPPPDLRPITREYAVVQEEDESTWQEVMDFYGFEASLSGRFVTRTKSAGEQKIFLLSEGAERFMRSKTKMPTRLVLCGVAVLKRANSYHERACKWQLDQPGILSTLALGMKRRINVSGSFLARLLREKELTMKEVREAAAAGAVSGLEALGGSDLRPGSLAVALDEGDCARQAAPCMLAVAATLTDDTLELAVGNAALATSLLEELEGQPSVAEILCVPADAEDGKDAGLDDADPEAAEPGDADIDDDAAGPSNDVPV